MKFTPDDYISAAPERVQAASRLYEKKQYVESVYLAGVAVECILRGFSSQGGEAFDARHDLQRLLKAATLEKFVGQQHRRVIAAALGEVWSRWKNSHRYAPESRIRKEFKNMELDRGIKGDALKENSRLTIESAYVIVNKGAYQWKKK